MTSGDGGIGGVDICYVGGVEHAVLHLLYSVSGTRSCMTSDTSPVPNPSKRLYNQEYIQAAAYQDDRGIYVDAEKVTEKDGIFLFEEPSRSLDFRKMGKSLKIRSRRTICIPHMEQTLSGFMKCSWDRWTKTGLETKSVVGSHRLCRECGATLLTKIQVCRQLLMSFPLKS